MKVGKPKSKRVPVRLRHKIIKSSASKQRKERKEAKKSPQWKSRINKDPGIPNSFPFKAQVLAEIEEARSRKAEEAQKRREVAKAQRLGTAVGGEVAQKAARAEDDDEELLDAEADTDDDEDMDEDGSNPMAALLASAQARATSYGKDDEGEDDEEDDESEDDEWNGISEPGKPALAKVRRKALPSQALADPVKAISALLERMQKTQDGIQRLIDHYQLPPLVIVGNDAGSRFLVEVARKRGRLGKGGVPNLYAAGLLVLNDLNEERLRLPAVEGVQKKPASAAGKGKGAVQVVTKKAEPFRIEGLFGDDSKDFGDTAMEI
ncbi:hypothetical protein LTR08_008996 [Meristemomyces frigidus]|nr:hypothetical protein LTR08_008996 [Meristemomyces frigidus]